MRRVNFPRIVSALVLIVATVVIAGWVFNIPALTRLNPDWVTMKFITAVCFVLSGLLLFFIDINNTEQSPVNNIIISVSSAVIIFFMGALLISVIFAVPTGIEELVVRESPGAVKTFVPGQPSVATMVSFLTIAFLGVLARFRLKISFTLFLWFGLFISTLGFCALLGYVLNAPLLYFLIKDVSGAMSIHTAVLFCLIGLGFVFLEEPEENGGGI